MKTVHHNPNSFEQVGDSLRNAMNVLKVGAVLGGAAIGLSGCSSPSGSSYRSGSYTTIPAPPAEARVQISLSTDEHDNVFVNYLCWDQKNSNFVRRDVHYSAARVGGLAGYGNYTERGGYEQAIKDGEVLGSGVIVDQKNGKLLLRDGLSMDGRTGDITDPSGKVVKHLEK